MAPGENSFRVRAASILHPFATAKRNDNDEKAVDRVVTLNEKRVDQAFGGQPHHSSGSNAEAHDRVAQRLVRTVPGP